MKRLGLYLAVLLPALLLGLWSVFPEADPSFAAPLLHFYIVTFTTFAATVVSLFVVISVGETARPRHLLLAMAYAWMGAVFFIHGFTTPGALITQFHPGVTWSAWLTLSGGGVIFLASALTPAEQNGRVLRRSAAIIALVYLIYVAVVVSIPDALRELQALPISPTLTELVFAATLAVWLAGSVKHYFNYRQSRNFIDGLMAFEAAWLATATVSMFRFQLWHASWWVYHALLLAGFLVASYALWRAYEQVRAFRLTHYYGATSLIVTAGLALIAAHVYAELVFRNLQQQLEAEAVRLTAHLGRVIAASLPDVASAEDLRAASFDRETAQSVGATLDSLDGLDAVTLFDTTGRVVYSTIVSEGQGAMPPDPLTFRETLEGTIGSELLAPGSQPGGYTPSAEAHVLEVHAPFYADGALAGPIGVLVALREAPQLARSLALSRGTGLLLAAASLGGLFSALLAIVYRADRLIQSRTRELERAYANLRQAEGLRDDLTRMIVHDLRTPLTALTANLDLINKTINNPAYRQAPPRFLAGARAAGQRMTGIIDDLLNVGKFEAGELRPVLAPIYLPTLIGEEADSYRSQAEKEEKRLAVRASADLPTVMADAALVGRVIDNLLSNAFKYTERGGCIEIQAEQRGQDIVVRVVDDGQGIPAQYHQHIFEKFVQVTEANGTPLRKGTGLGLAFCRLAVEAHGGQIRVESLPGQGSIFFFNLPLNHHA
ncbi:MAG: sensor histidine kinase [Anaerolineales bacterium]|nr:sensor histidine kinase [Anaerolineales bacterium]